MHQEGAHSILAIDKKAGEVGVAIQSHAFAVGSRSVWAEPGVGAVVAHGVVESSYGPLGLALMRGGKTPQQALKSLLATDPTPGVRQVAMIDSRGRVAAHTGNKCLAESGHETGRGFSVQGNLVKMKKVWKATASGFRRGKGSLAEKLVSALESGEQSGGEMGGPRSAAVVVVRTELSSTPWQDKLVDIRVDSHEAPSRELRRLLKSDLALRHAAAGDGFFAKGDAARGEQSYSKARALSGGGEEITDQEFWLGVGLINSGELEKGKRNLLKSFRKGRDLKKVFSGLVDAGLIKAGTEELRGLI